LAWTRNPKIHSARFPVWPSRLIAALATPLSLMPVEPPLDPGIDQQFMFYPTRAQFDPGSIWLRNLMLETGRGLDRRKRRSG